MLLERRVFLGLMAFIWCNFKSYSEAKNIFNMLIKEKAELVYRTITQQRHIDRDLIGPKVNVINKPEAYVVNLERVLDNKESRYTVNATMSFTGKDKKIVSREMGIHRRRHGPEYKNSLIFMGDADVDGIADKGETSMTKKIITPNDPEWNKICKEKVFNPKAEEITYGALFMKEYDKALDDIITHLGIYKTAHSYIMKFIRI